MLTGLLACFNRSFKDRTRLHFGDFWIGYRQTATAMAEHRIELMKTIGTLAQSIGVNAHGACHFCYFFISAWQEFVQRRIEQPDCDRQAFHDLEQLDKIRALHRQKLC